MKEAYLRKAYTRAVKILKAERIARSVVLARHPHLEKKLADIDFVLNLLVEMKDELKPYLEDGSTLLTTSLAPEQAPLIDMPSKYP